MITSTKKKRFRSIWLIALLMVSFASCNQQARQNGNSDIKQFSKNETEKWKKELLLNGDVGTPCEEDHMKWNTKNPEAFYGLPDSINSKVFDVNSDKIKDVLLYFPAGDCCTCSIGMNEKSDFVKLIYSDGNGYLTNENLRAKIEQKIENKFFEQTNIDVQRVVFTITDFNAEISGTYQLWTLEDPDCCAGYLGTFKYNPFTWKIEIGEKKVLN